MTSFEIRDEILETMSEDRRGDPTLISLANCLGEFLAATGPQDRLLAWVRLVDWTRETVTVPAAGSSDEPADSTGRLSTTFRLRSLLRLLETNPKIHGDFVRTVGVILEETDGLSLFAEVGIPSDRGFLAEFADRLSSRFIPRPRNVENLNVLLSQMFRSIGHAEQFERLPVEIIERITRVLSPAEHKKMWERIEISFADAFRLLSARVQAQGLSQKLRVRSHYRTVTESPFYRFSVASEDVLQNWLLRRELKASIGSWRHLAQVCRDEMAEISRRLEKSGVSVDIVYGIEVLELCLRRMNSMVLFFEAVNSSAKSDAVQKLISALIRAAIHEKSVSFLVSANLRLLHKKIVDRSGETGEHYIAENKEEYWGIWAAAAGGGAITVFTAAFKMKILNLGLAPFMEGFVAGLNYAVSFLIMQAAGFVLATKQPAMTAATLATILKGRSEKDRLDEIVTLVSRISHSQIAAAVSNVTIVTLGAIAFHWVWSLFTPHPFLSEAEADHVFHSLSPISSGTVLFAAETGVILWMSSLIGGWFDNWSVYHQVSRGLKDLRILRFLGQKRINRFSDLFEKNFAGWATSISLGMMLGMAPSMGHFFGLPLDVRHVTLSTGTLALASASLGTALLSPNFLFWAGCGIATMFVLNLSVSFFLSLFTAARAYELTRQNVLTLIGLLIKRFVKNPWIFFFPPKRLPPLDTPIPEEESL